jgi:hypothetical protein
LEHFSPETDPKIDFPNMDEMALLMIDDARSKAGIPFSITSTYRTPEHSVEVGGSGKDAHTEHPCSAFDIAYSSKPERARIIFACHDSGFIRIGINEKNGHVHVDNSPNLPSPAFWIE